MVLRGGGQKPQIESTSTATQAQTRSTTGALIGVNEMPNLPPSVLATMNSDRSVGTYKPYLQTVLFEKELRAAEFVISGQQKLDIQIVK